MKISTPKLATWVVLAVSPALVSKKDHVEAVIVVGRCCQVSILLESPFFCVDDIFVIVVVNVVGSRTITTIKTDDVVGTKDGQRHPFIVEFAAGLLSF